MKATQNHLFRVRVLGTVACVFSSLACCSTLAAQPKITISAQRGHPGRVTAVLGRLSDTTNITAVQFDVNYDPNHVTLNAVTLPSFLTNHVLWSHELLPGLRRVLVFSQSNTKFRTNETLALLSFATPLGERVGSGPITPSNIFLSQPDAFQLQPVEARAGAVFVSQVARNPQNGEVLIFFPSVAGRRYVLQATADFKGWVNLSTNVAEADFIDLVDASGPSYPYRYYRLADYDSLLAGVLGDISHPIGGPANFKLTGWEGRTYEIQASTNLTNWVTIGTRSVTNGQILFQDSDAAVIPRRFYRLKSTGL